MRKLHLFVGLGGLAAFLGTGVYLAKGFPELYRHDEALRFIYRANHVYVLLSSLVNLTLGVYLVPASAGWRSIASKLGSCLALASPVILLIAFVVETARVTPDRPLTSLGVALLLVGTLAQLPNYRRSS